MPRPLRLQFENAWYHVYNRGAGYKSIFKDRAQGELFLEILANTSKLFGIEIHAYCLLQNQYHLLIKTPRANLSRAMRHLNGVYTQRFNRMEQLDGALFRGRYKAILIDPQVYLLQVSRHIHLLPVSMKLANDPIQYKWSSYIYYLQKKQNPIWLCTQYIEILFSKINSYKSYKDFVNAGLDLETQSFYAKLNTPAIFGSETFKIELLQSLPTKKNITIDIKNNQNLPSMNKINRICADFFNLDETELYRNGRGKRNDARKIAMYACRVWASEKIALIAKQYNIRSHTLISNVVSEIEKRLKTDETFFEKIQQIQKLIFA